MPSAGARPLVAAPRRRRAAAAHGCAGTGRCWSWWRRPLLLLLVFHYLPTLGNVIAFQDYNPYVGDNALEAFVDSEWIGFGNFETLFADRRRSGTRCGTR